MYCLLGSQTGLFVIADLIQSGQRKVLSCLK
jgi:hypothetical protein